MFALTNGLVQVADRALFQGGLGGDATAAGGAVQQQFGDQPRAAALAQQALGLVVVDQPLQLRAGLFLQQGQALVQAALAIERRRDAVETHQGMQALAGQGFAPVVLAVVVAGDEVEHRQQRFAAHGQHGQFVAVLGQHGLAGVDHVEAGVRDQQLAQHLGFLFEALARLAAVEKARQPLWAVQAFAGAVEALQVVEQGDGVFQAGGVVQLQQCGAVHRQPRALDMAGGAGAMGHLAEADVAGQGAQQRGLAGIGMADHGEFQRLAHPRLRRVDDALPIHQQRFVLGCIRATR